MMLDNMSRLHRYQTISISPENLTGEKGKGGAMPVEQGSSYEAAHWLEGQPADVHPGGRDADAGGRS